jgi:DNA (cytosine-5)-methyltransferase 1
MLENVPRLMRDKRLLQVKRELDALGYSVVCDILDAADYGVPQRRKRMILMAIRGGCTPSFAPKAKISKHVRDTIQKLEKRSRKDPLHDASENRSSRILAMIRAIPHDGGSRRSLAPDQQLECHRDFDGFKDVYGRMAWDDFAPTLTSGCVNPSRGRFLHPVCDRAITLREAALLQSFPMKHRFPLTKGKYAVARLIGNALPPEFIRRHAVQLLNCMQDEVKPRRTNGRRNGSSKS